MQQDDQNYQHLKGRFTAFVVKNFVGLDWVLKIKFSRVKSA